MIFRHNSNPINVCNRVLKRLVNEGKIKSIPREKDKTYLYSLNPSPINHKSNKIEHTLKIVDFYIAIGMPKQFAIEPTLGTYEPDIMYNKSENICVEIQITPISRNKMQQKINQFVFEYNKEHNSKLLIICSDYQYNKLSVPNGFKMIQKFLPKEIQF